MGEARRRGGGGDVMETCDEKDAAVLVAQKDPRVLSSHARHGSCAGRRVDGAKLASGAIAASTRQRAPIRPSSRPKLRPDSKSIAHVETPPTWCMAVGPSGGRLDPYASFFAAS